MRVVPRRSVMTLEFVCRWIISVLPPVSESAFLLWPCNPGLVARTVPGQRGRPQQVHVIAQSCLTLQLHGLWHARLPCPSLSPGVCLNSHPLSQWCHPTISSFVVPGSSCLQSFPSIRIFSNESALCIKWPKYWSFSFSMSPSSEYSGWFPLRLTGLISLLSKGLSRVFSSTTVQKHQFFGAQPSLWSNSHLRTLLEKS